MIFIDMDGVLADFVTAACRVHGRQPAHDHERLHEAWGISSREFWWEIESHGDSFWALLDEYSWSRDLVVLAKEFGPISIATSPALSPDCAAGKVAWLQRFFGNNFREFMIGPRKHLLAKPGAILIDDTVRHCDDFREAGGEAILFPQPWNVNRDLCGDRLGYVWRRLQEWKNREGQHHWREAKVG